MIDEVNQEDNRLPERIEISSQGPNKKHGKRIRLPDNFAPGKYSVLCGRGSKCTKSTGNTNLKHLVQGYLKPYSEAKNKVEKTSIVSAIIASVKQSSPDGAFVKFEDGAWWEVEDAFAREKIGCLFRDCLHTQYKSSTKAKLARKKATFEPIPMDESCSSMGGNHSQTGIHTSIQSLSNSFTRMGEMHGKSILGLNPDGTNFIKKFSEEDSPMGSFQQDRSLMNPLFGSNTMISSMNQSTTTSNDVDFGGMALKGKDFKANAFMNNYFGYNNNARPPREDFMSDCLPMMSQVNRMNDINSLLSSNPMRQSAEGMLVGETRSQQSSLLRAACSIVGHINADLDDEDDDLPDDISDIFDEDDGQVSSAQMDQASPMPINPNFSFQNNFKL